MPKAIAGLTILRIGEVLRRAGISRATYFRWVRAGRIPDSRFKDRNGRRVLTAEEVEQLETFSNKLIDTSPEIPIIRDPLK